MRNVNFLDDVILLWCLHIKLVHAPTNQTACLPPVCFLTLLLLFQVFLRFRGSKIYIGLCHSSGDHVLHLAPADPHHLTTSICFIDLYSKGLRALLVCGMAVGTSFFIWALQQLTHIMSRPASAFIDLCSEGLRAFLVCDTAVEIMFFTWHQLTHIMSPPSSVFQIYLQRV